MRMNDDGKMVNGMTWTRWYDDNDDYDDVITLIESITELPQEIIYDQSI